MNLFGAVNGQPHNSELVLQILIVYNWICLNKLGNVVEDWNKYYIYTQEGDLVSKYTNKPLCNYDKEGYIRVRRGNKEYRAHRIIWEMHYGSIPDGYLIDHINGDKLNNRISNLRLATRQQNNLNSVKRTGTVLPKGVVRVGDRYRARITRNSKTISLGTFDTPEEAGKVYSDYAKEVDGEFYKEEL